MIVRREALAVARRVRPGQADRVAGAVCLVEQQAAAEVAGDGLQGVGVHSVAGAGANLPDDEDGVGALPGQLAEPGGLLPLTRGRLGDSVGHWSILYIRVDPG